MPLPDEDGLVEGELAVLNVEPDAELEPIELVDADAIRRRTAPMGSTLLTTQGFATRTVAASGRKAFATRSRTCCW
jgi:hypothetical protein